MDLPKPTEANELRDAARVIAVRLVPHGAQPGLHVTAFKADRVVPRCTQLAFGAATQITPKFISLSDPAAQWTAALKGPAFFSYSTNYLIDTDHGVIVDVEATRSIHQAEVGAARTMLDRTEDRFGLKPGYLTADTAYGTAQNLAWLVKHKQITPHIPVFDKSTRTDGTFSRSDFTFDAEAKRYTCPAGKHLIQFRRVSRQHEGLRHLPSQDALLPEYAGAEDPAGCR